MNQLAERTTEEELLTPDFLRKIERLSLVAKRVFPGRTRGERRSTKRGASVEFADYRNYTPGDDFRYIDWNIYGRMKKLLLRLFEEEEDLYIYLLIDSSGSMMMGDPAKFDYARRVAAALAYIGLANLDRVNIIPFADELKPQLSPKRGKGQIFRVFEYLGAVRPGGQTDIETAFKSFVHQTKRRGLAVVVSDFFDPKGYERGLKLLCHHKFETFALQVCDPLEAEPAVKGDLRLLDTETGEERIATVNPQVLRAYRQEFQEYCERLESFCTSVQTGFIRTLTSTPFEELVLKVFRQGQFLK